MTGIVTPSRLTGGFGQADKRFVTKVLDRIAREVRRGARRARPAAAARAVCPVRRSLGAARAPATGTAAASHSPRPPPPTPPPPRRRPQLRRAKRLDLRSLVIIRTARIPIIKLSTGPASGSVVADVSLGDESGPAAARYVTQQIAGFPPLAPLVLVLKVYLRRCGLNEVSVGGLSSYSLTLMVLAHLQEEVKAGRDVFDLGEALYGFLLRYGEEFDYGGGARGVLGGGAPRCEQESGRGCGSRPVR